MDDGEELSQVKKKVRENHFNMNNIENKSFAAVLIVL